ncbi:Uncharacterized protein ChrSV_5194 [Chromobacterium vaccinii]|nr:Uncharacterized protein ChrSW_5188 [Chromobacterium vaccinii]QND92649.1 Uncharacterized protein ChrSV_5194 [Chromobacterium vaccinii]
MSLRHAPELRKAPLQRGFYFRASRSWRGVCGAWMQTGHR